MNTSKLVWLPLLLSACGDLGSGFDIPDLLNGCLKASSTIRAEYPNWEAEVELAASEAGVDIYPSNNPTCLNSLKFGSGFESGNLSRTQGSGESKFEIELNSVERDGISDNASCTAPQVRLSTILVREFLGITGNPITDEIEVCDAAEMPDAGSNPSAETEVETAPASDAGTPITEANPTLCDQAVSPDEAWLCASLGFGPVAESDAGL